MKLKNRLLDPALWVLIGVNGYLVYYYYHHPAIFTTLVWLYWAQSVMLGFFNFLDMLTVRTVKPQIDASGNSSMFEFRKKAAFFFLFHYGFFHFGYMIFLFTLKRSGPFDYYFFRNCCYLFLAGQILTFIRHKMIQKTQPANLATMFFLPYLRIVPMHLTILLPNFIAVSSMGIFLVLKTVADVGMYIATAPKTNNKLESEALLSAQQSGGEL